MPTWIIAIGFITKLILVGLLALSVWSVAIMRDRSRVFKMLDSIDPFEEARTLIEKKNFTELKVWAEKRTGGLRAGTIKAAMANKGAEKIERAVKSFLAFERTKAEKGFTALATLGSNSPFIGLFGTVLGIIQAFGALAVQKSDSTSVMSAVSEALIATAIGLLVAIPAVVAYNIYNRKLKVLLTECESLRDLYISKED